MGGTLCVGVRSFIGGATLSRVSNREPCGSARTLGLSEGFLVVRMLFYNSQLSSRTFLAEAFSLDTGCSNASRPNSTL